MSNNDITATKVINKRSPLNHEEYPSMVMSEYAANISPLARVNVDSFKGSSSAIHAIKEGVTLHPRLCQLTATDVSSATLIPQRTPPKNDRIVAPYAACAKAKVGEKTPSKQVHLQMVSDQLSLTLNLVLVLALFPLNNPTETLRSHLQ